MVCILLPVPTCTNLLRTTVKVILIGKVDTSCSRQQPSYLNEQSHCNNPWLIHCPQLLVWSCWTSPEYTSNLVFKAIFSGSLPYLGLVHVLQSCGPLSALFQSCVVEHRFPTLRMLPQPKSQGQKFSLIPRRSNMIMGWVEFLTGIYQAKREREAFFETLQKSTHEEQKSWFSSTPTTVDSIWMDQRLWRSKKKKENRKERRRRVNLI